MTVYFSNDFRAGLKVILDGEPCEIESSEFVKPGKGQAFVRVKLRRLLTKIRFEKTFKATDFVKSADIIDINLIYLYNDNKFWYFMDNRTFEQLEIDIQVVGDNAKWLSDQAECTVTLWNSQPISIIPPNFVELKIIDADPYLKGNTVSSNIKSAVLSTGAIVKVPLFIQIGEIIKVDTRSGEYISRVK